LKVLSPYDIPDISYDYILIGTSLYFDEVRRFLNVNLSVPENKIISFTMLSDADFHAQRKVYQDSIMSITDKKKVYLFCTPDHGNLGDHAIAEAVHYFFSDIKYYEVIEFPSSYHDNFSELARHFIKKDDLILITGGGFLGSLWLQEEKAARRVIDEYKDNQVIILPQTVFWDTDSTATRELEHTRQVYARHKRLTLCARDKTTFENIRNRYADNQTLLVPDMVLYNDWNDYFDTSTARRGLLLCLKGDKESAISDEQRQAFSCTSRNLGLQMSYCDTDLYRPVAKKNRKTLLGSILQIFRNAELVITNRLHGYIFAAITGTPCVVLNGYNHKNRETFEWVKHLPYMRFASCFEDIENLAQEVLDCGSGEYNNAPLMRYFDELKRLVLHI